MKTEVAITQSNIIEPEGNKKTLKFNRKVK